MNIFAKVIYPADLWSLGAKLIQACIQTVCWIWCSRRSQCAAIELHRYYYCTASESDIYSHDKTKYLQCCYLFGETVAAFQYIVKKVK